MKPLLVEFIHCQQLLNEYKLATNIEIFFYRYAYKSPVTLREKRTVQYVGTNL